MIRASNGSCCFFRPWSYIFLMLGMTLLNIMYAAIVVNYSLRCDLLSFYINCILDLVKEKRTIRPFKAMAVSGFVFYMHWYQLINTHTHIYFAFRLCDILLFNCILSLHVVFKWKCLSIEVVMRLTLSVYINFVAKIIQHLTWIFGGFAKLLIFSVINKAYTKLWSHFLLRFVWSLAVYISFQLCLDVT